MNSKTRTIIGAGVLAVIGIYLYLKKGMNNTSLVSSGNTISDTSNPILDITSVQPIGGTSVNQSTAAKDTTNFTKDTASKTTGTATNSQPTMQILSDAEKTQSSKMQEQKNQLSVDPLGLNTFTTAFKLQRITTDSKGDYIERGDSTTLYNKDGAVIGNLNDYSGFFEDTSGRTIATSNGVGVSYNDTNGNYIENSDPTTLYNVNGDAIGSLNADTGNYEDGDGNIIDLSINNAGSGSTTNDAFGISNTSIFSNDSFGGGSGGGGNMENIRDPFQFQTLS